MKKITLSLTDRTEARARPELGKAEKVSGVDKSVISNGDKLGTSNLGDIIFSAVQSAIVAQALTPRS